ncbi:hypothetical protein [Natronorarus salvus]|uniref:hypothetical protein n=1 Tax=Natronorarus salvus TaxID=3117733 RepID=UPI002F266484
MRNARPLRTSTANAASAISPPSSAPATPVSPTRTETPIQVERAHQRPEGDDHARGERDVPNERDTGRPTTECLDHSQLERGGLDRDLEADEK